MVEVHIHDSRSLKAKRGVMKSLIRRTQNEFNCSIAEVASHDNWKQGVIGFAVVGTDTGFVTSKIDKIMNFLENLQLAEIVDARREIASYTDMVGRYDTGWPPHGLQES